MQYQFVCEIEREGRVPEEIVFSVDLPPGKNNSPVPRNSRHCPSTAK